MTREQAFWQEYQLAVLSAVLIRLPSCAIWSGRIFSVSVISANTCAAIYGCSLGPGASVIGPRAWHNCCAYLVAWVRCWGCFPWEIRAHDASAR